MIASEPAVVQDPGDDLGFSEDDGGPSKRARMAGDMSPRSARLLEAIGVKIESKVEPLQLQMNGMSAQLATINLDLSTMKAEQARTSTRLDGFERRLSACENGSRPGSDTGSSGGGGGGGGTGSASGAGGRYPGNHGGGGGGGGDPGGNPYSRPSIQDRDVLVVGGFPEGTSKELREGKLEDMFGPVRGDLNDLWAPGRYATCGKVRFVSATKMWAWIRSNRRVVHNFVQGDVTHKLWWSVEKSEDERQKSKRVSKAIAAFRQRAMRIHGLSEEDSRKLLEGDWARGIAYYRFNGSLLKLMSSSRITGLPEPEAGLAPSGLLDDITADQFFAGVNTLDS